MSYAPTQKPIMVKSNSAADSQILRAPVMHRHRKTVSTGGGRAWSDAEVRIYENKISVPAFIDKHTGSISHRDARAQDAI